MISIYDFSILPYALGDILTWNVKQCVKALALGQEFVDVYIHCGDPVNVHQDKYVNSGNEKSFLYDILPAFYTNPMLRNLHIFHDHHAMCLAMKENDAVNHFGGWTPGMIMHDLNKILYREICTHSDINEHFKFEGSIPHLVAPKGFAQKYQEDWEGKTLIAVNLRARMVDKSLGPIDPNRDSNLEVWTDFFMQMRSKMPNLWFVLMGKPEEKTHARIDLSNVRYPRIRGWNLAQELALISYCDGFMGSCSGFAAMSVFGKNPYVITKLTDASYDFYGVPRGTKHLPFASDKQFLMQEDESVENLMWYFERFLVK